MVDMNEAKWSVQNGDLDKVKQACSQSGFNVNADCGMGRALIHCAADYGQKDVLEYLLSIGANINQLDKHGISPLLNAVFEGHTSCVKLLLDKGADKTVKAPSGESIADVAEKDEIKAMLR